MVAVGYYRSKSVDIPIDAILQVLKLEQLPKVAFTTIIQLGKQACTSPMWEYYQTMNIERDIIQAQRWITQEVQSNAASGIYLGLDTLNMDGGLGSNVEIGLTNQCHPQSVEMDWMFTCEDYGKPHLIHSLWQVADELIEEEFNAEEERFVEYVIFLAYSGVVLREALLTMNHPRDFLSVWGFHDGDIFFLVQSINQEKKVVTDWPY